MGEDVGDPWQESMIICNHPDEFLQGLDGLGRREPGDGFNLVLCWSNAIAGEGMAEELHFGFGQGTLLWMKYETILPKALKNDPQMLKVLLDCPGEDEDVIDVHRAEGQVPQDHIHRPLEGGPSIAEPEAGEVKREGTERRRHSSLRYIHLQLLLLRAPQRWGHLPEDDGYDPGGPALLHGVY